MIDLAEFLLARIAEDEAAAVRAAHEDRGLYLSAGGRWATADSEITTAEGHPIGRIWSPEPGTTPTAVHIARWDPARVLAECGAKRRIVAWHRLIDGLDVEDNPVRGCGNCIPSGAESPYLVAGPCMTVRLLALPYADHHDYRQEWKP